MNLDLMRQSLYFLEQRGLSIASPGKLASMNKIRYQVHLLNAQRRHFQANLSFGIDILGSPRHDPGIWVERVHFGSEHRVTRRIGREQSSLNYSNAQITVFLNSRLAWCLRTVAQKVIGRNKHFCIDQREHFHCNPRLVQGSQESSKSLR